MSDIREYVPAIYKDVVEMETLVEVNDELLDLEEGFINDLESSQFINKAPEHAIAEYERLLKILPKTTDSIEFRRLRIINRLSMTPPFSLPYLREKLDSIIGKGKYTCYIDYNEYTLYVESSANNQFWADEIYITINKLKPANIVFINKPLIVYNNIISETVELAKTVYNYKLGTTWALGQKPFGQTESEGVLKMAETPSIQQEFLNQIATFSADDINNVLLNDTEIITEFSVKSATENVAIIEYTVTSDLGLSEITNIKLRDINNNILTSSAVYVPVLEDVIIKHSLNVKEGV